MRLAQLRALVTVIETGSFSEAALELGVSQAAVSRAIEALETDLGARLLRRGRSGAQNTALGERVAAHARAVLQLEEAMRQEVGLAKGASATLRGSLRIGTFSSVARRAVVPLMAELRREHPALELTLVEDSPEGVEERLRAGRVDVGFIRARPGEEDAFIVRELWCDVCVALLPAGPQPRKTRLTWDDVAGVPLIIKAGAVCRASVMEALEQAPWPLEPRYAVKDERTLVGMVAAGMGIGFAPRLAVEPLPETVYAAVPPAPILRVVKVAVLPHALAIPAVSAFLRLLDAHPSAELFGSEGALELSEHWDDDVLVRAKG